MTSIAPRRTFALTVLALNLCSRSLHCQAGKARLWFAPPGWA